MKNKYPYSFWEPNPGRPARTLVITVTKLPRLHKTFVNLENQIQFKDPLPHTNFIHLPVPVAARSKARMVLDRTNTGIVGSNPAPDMYGPRFSVLYYPL